MYHGVGTYLFNNMSNKNNSKQNEIMKGKFYYGIFSNKEISQINSSPAQQNLNQSKLT